MYSLHLLTAARASSRMLAVTAPLALLLAACDKGITNPKPTAPSSSAALVPTLPEKPGDATACPVCNKIVFVKKLPVFEQNAIYTVNPDGSGKTFLHFGSEPTWSPDHSRIAFFGWGPNHVLGLHTMDLNGASLQLVTPGMALSPAYSPDGKYIVFARKEEVDTAQFDLWRVNVDGTGLTQLTSTPTISELSPSISDDGTKIVMERYGNIIPQIAVLDLTTNQTNALLNASLAIAPRRPRFGPGGKIAFVNAGTSGETSCVGVGWIPLPPYSFKYNVYPTGQKCDAVSLSPNGDQVVYHELPATSDPATPMTAGVLKRVSLTYPFPKNTVTNGPQDYDPAWWR